ncbi:acyltransferase domain-containing protein [Paenibacillus larvae]
MIAFIFPGQGSQTVGMCKGYYDKFPEIFNPLFEEANDTLGFDLKKICLYGPMEQLTETSVAQPAILTVSTGISRVLASMNKGIDGCGAQFRTILGFSRGWSITIQ